MKSKHSNLFKISIYTWIFLSFSIHIYAQNTSIPDANFEQALIDLGYDTAPTNGMIPTANINSITNLDVTNKNIADLTGIEGFIALLNLTCDDNDLTSVDLSNNTELGSLRIRNNKLTELDLTSNTEMLFLFCNDNQITNLNISTCTDLEWLECFDNELTSLNINNNLELRSIHVGSNLLTSPINVENNTKLEQLFVYDNKLTEINVSQNTALKGLNIAQNNIQSLNIDANINLESIGFGFTDITSISLLNNINLNFINCRYNQLKEINLDNNTLLEQLYIDNNQLTELDLSNNAALIRLTVHDNQLTNLNIKNGNNTNFTLFDTKNNPDLTCIIVDDKNYSATNWTEIDNGTSFLESDAECQALSIEDFAIEGFKMYPNPVSDQLTITSKNMMVNEVNIYDHTGRMVKNIQWNGKSTRLSNLAPGMYILRIKTDQGTTARKILKI